MGNGISDLVLVPSCSKRSDASTAGRFPSRSWTSGHADRGRSAFRGSYARLAGSGNHARDFDNRSSLTTRCPHRSKRSKSGSTVLTTDSRKRKACHPRIPKEQRALLLNRLSRPWWSGGLSKGTFRSRPARSAWVGIHAGKPVVPTPTETCATSSCSNGLRISCDCRSLKKPSRQAGYREDAKSRRSGLVRPDVRRFLASHRG